MKIRRGRWAFIVGLLVIMTAVMGCSSSEPAGAGANPDLSKKVLLVRAKEGGGENGVINRLKNQGYTVYDVVDEHFKIEQASDYGLIYISPAVNSSKVDTRLKQSTVPVVVSKTQVAGLLGMGGVANFGESTGVKTIEIRDEKHPLAAGLKGTVAIYQEEGTVSYSQSPSKEAAIIAEHPVSGNNKQYTVFAYEKGAKNNAGDEVPARQVFFSLPAGESAKLTDSGWQLFDAAIAWAAGNEGK